MRSELELSSAIANTSLEIKERENEREIGEGE